VYAAALTTPTAKNAYLGFSEHDGYCTGQPKPQYVPVCTPWLYGQRFTKDLIPGTKSPFCKESQVCYGTYLPSSTAQVRRTTTFCNGNLGLGGRSQVFWKNQFNLAKGLRATQVHDIDTPSPFSQRLGGGVGSKSLNIYKNTCRYRGYIR
jgi:hypothetical protein